MENMRESQIISIFDAMSRMASLDKGEVTSKIKKYSKMSDEEVIIDLSLIVFSYFKDDPDIYDYFLNLIRNVNPKIAPSAEVMKKELENLLVNDDVEVSLNENHDLVLKTFKDVASLFNKSGIDYCVVGALPCYLKRGIPLFRLHNDIDIMINEDDLEMARSIIEKYGYTFIDRRFPGLDEFRSMKESDKSHPVVAENPNKKFYIDFQVFRRERDNGITTIEYLQRENNNEVVVDRLERHYSPLASDLRFNDVCNYDGVEARVNSAEYVYECKSNSKKQKDIDDALELNNYIDREKLKELRRNTNTKEIIKDVLNDKMTL